MTITSAIIGTSRGSGQFDTEERVALTALRARGIPIIEATPRLIQRGRVKVTPETLVVGTISLVHEALRSLGIPIPEPNDYPSELQPFLHRKIWSAKLGDSSVQGCFVKPKQVKRFTGRVLYGRPDPFLFGGASLQTPVWVSPPVTFLKEWRCFVAHGELLGARPCPGEATEAELDLGVVQAAIRALVAPPGGFSLDFGVLSTGETALVEMNHGYSLGSYGLAPDLYLRVLEAFWEWVVRSSGTSLPTTPPTIPATHPPLPPQ